MKIDVRGNRVEPISFVLLIICIWIISTITMTATVLYVVLCILRALFHLPAALLQRKGARG